ncbi:unnamed protein product [Rotaria socialis]|uniref:Uncharacterized protein n=2 Tax=Rotaria socialis TaxID=392032 RepID=A0A820G2V7_9BILA|nr:unnamed protein product [Rotaria socialis]CAF4272840.1 unnamed protein product [Rotaria socialis]
MSPRSGMSRGVTTGQLIASHILDTTKSGRSENRIVYTSINEQGYHQPDPSHPNQGYLTPHWRNLKPFLLDVGSQFRASDIVRETPAVHLLFLSSMLYKNDINEVKAFGGRATLNRVSDQTEIDSFWAYDDNARLFALVNYVMADAGIAVWDSKYYYSLWCPIVGIRQRTTSNVVEHNWRPLGAPTNGTDDNFTPEFPSYVSGHVTFGSAVFYVLWRFYDADDISFEFQSDEYNGKTVDSITRRARPVRIRRYRSFTEADTEDLLSRTYLGVPWRIDQEEGQSMDQKVGSFVFDQLSQ